MLCRVYQGHGICVRSHCRAEPPRDIEPAGLVTTVGGRDRTSTWHAAADGVKAPASAARGRFRGVHGGRPAPSVPAETRTVSGVGYLAGSVPPLLVRSPGCSRTPPRPHGSIDINETANQNQRQAEDNAEAANVRKEIRNEDQTDQRVRRRSGEGAALLYGSDGLREED